MKTQLSYIKKWYFQLLPFAIILFGFIPFLIFNRTEQWNSNNHMLILVPVWIVMLIVQWYIQYGRFYDVHTDGYTIHAKNIISTKNISHHQIIEIKKCGKKQLPFYQKAHLIHILYRDSEGKTRKLKFLSLKLKKGEIPNVGIYKTIVDESKLVNF